MRRGELGMVTESYDGEMRNAGPNADQVRYALWLLLVIYTLNFMDRQIIAILAEPIKVELDLTDTQLGLLGGIAFAFFYTVLGIPIARLAERGNRVRIISIAVIVWSFFTAVCGMVQNFTQLLVARIGVGVGEAGCTPPAHSLIADYVPPERRASALAFYSTGVPIGAALGYVVGAYIAAHFGWRSAFLAVGLPGIAVGLLAWLTLKEPRQSAPPEIRSQPISGSTSFAMTLKVLLRQRSYVYGVMGAAAITFLGYGQTYFLPSFLTRVHEMELAERGLALALMTFIAGVSGTLIGGRIADHFASRDVRAYMIIPAIAVAAGIPFFLFAMQVSSATGAIVLVGMQTLLNCLWYGPIYAAIQGLVAPGNRATAVAVMLFVINLFGLGLGPSLVGFASDVLASANFADLSGGLAFAKHCSDTISEIWANHCVQAQGEGLRQALMATNVFGLLGFAAFVMGARSLTSDLEAAHAR